MKGNYFSLVQLRYKAAYAAIVLSKKRYLIEAIILIIFLSGWYLGLDETLSYGEDFLVIWIIIYFILFIISLFLEFGYGISILRKMLAFDLLWVIMELIIFGISYFFGLIDWYTTTAAVEIAIFITGYVVTCTLWFSINGVDDHVSAAAVWFGLEDHNSSPIYENITFIIIFGTFLPVIIIVTHLIFISKDSTIYLMITVGFLEFLYAVSYMTNCEINGSEKNKFTSFMTTIFLAIVLLGAFDATFGFLNEYPLKVSFVLSVSVAMFLAIFSAIIAGLLTALAYTLITSFIGFIITIVFGLGSKNAPELLWGVLVGIAIALVGVVISANKAFRNGLSVGNSVIAILAEPYSIFSLTFRTWFFDTSKYHTFDFFTTEVGKSMLDFSLFLFVFLIIGLGFIQGIALAKSNELPFNDIYDAIKVIENEMFPQDHYYRMNFDFVSDISGVPEHSLLITIRHYLRQYWLHIVIIMDMIVRIVTMTLQQLNLISFNLGLLTLLFENFTALINNIQSLFQLEIYIFNESISLIISLIVFFLGYSALVKRYRVTVKFARKSIGGGSIYGLVVLFMALYLPMLGLATFGKYSQYASGLLFIEACFFLLGYFIGLIYRD